MLLAIGIEVRSRGLEVRGVALRVLMKVDGMHAGGQILEIEFHSDSRGGVPQNRGTHSLTLGILKVNHSLGRTGGCECDHKQCERKQVSGFHGGIIAKSAAARSKAWE